MTVLLNTTDNIQPGDIVFTCGRCSKSLAIDPRGAGMVITCPDCGTEIAVPSLEDTTVEDVVVQEPVADDHRDDTIAALQARVAELERALHASHARFQAISDELGLIQSHLDRMVATILDTMPDAVPRVVGPES